MLKSLIAGFFAELAQCVEGLMSTREQKSSELPTCHLSKGDLHSFQKFSFHSNSQKLDFFVIKIYYNEYIRANLD